MYANSSHTCTHLHTLSQPAAAAVTQVTEAASTDLPNGMGGLEPARGYMPYARRARLDMRLELLDVEKARWHELCTRAPADRDAD